ncbi:SHOCT domain-containing protein [Alkalibacter sp. M17DMB]|nr:SHOCT domain-containing protein [Alkalibacter mobilis]
MFNRGFNIFGGCFNGGFMGPWMFLVIGGLILATVAIVLLVLNKRKKTGNEDSDLLEMLKERYVRGEITEEEYIEKKRVLRDGK